MAPSSGASCGGRSREGGCQRQRSSCGQQAAGRGCQEGRGQKGHPSSWQEARQKELSWWQAKRHSRSGWRGLQEWGLQLWLRDTSLLMYMYLYTLAPMSWSWELHVCSRASWRQGQLLLAALLCALLASALCCISSSARQCWHSAALAQQSSSSGRLAWHRKAVACTLWHFQQALQVKPAATGPACCTLHSALECIY